MAAVGADGKLPRTFSLEAERAPNEFGFMPGAMDDIGVFHADGRNNQEKAIKEAVGLLNRYFKTAKEQYLVRIEAFLADNRAVSVIDPILNSFRSNHEGLKPEQVVNLCLNILKTSRNIELVKIAIGLLGLFDLGNVREITETVATLGLYDDFTLYAVVAASNWSGGNDIVCHIAKHVEGWGKIHAVERLEPENPEIREWILRDGCSNSIMDAYLGLVCAEKGDLISALRQDVIDDSLFAGTAIIVDALLDEGPVNGISEYAHAEEALTLYLRHALKHVRRPEQLWRVLNVRLWAEDAEFPAATHAGRQRRGSAVT
jgi:hypothetical protein